MLGGEEIVFTTVVGFKVQLAKLFHGISNSTNISKVVANADKRALGLCCDGVRFMDEIICVWHSCKVLIL